MPGGRAGRSSASRHGPGAKLAHPERTVVGFTGDGGGMYTFQALWSAAHHRIGALAVGETSLLVAVSAAHREDAFAAALRTVDRIKETVPVWKKEFGPDGSHWQEGVEPKPVRRPS